MDKTYEYFSPLFEEQQAQKEKEEIDLEKQEDIAAFCMGYAITDGYTLTIDDVANVLDVEDRYIRDVILKDVYYVSTPAMSGSFFNENLDYHFWQMRYYKWKKIFIHRDSFIKYLCNYINKVEVVVEDDKTVTEHIEKLDAAFAELLLNGQIKPIRRCNIGDLVIAEKTDKFFSKTKNDINRWAKKEFASLAYDRSPDALEKMKEIEKRAEEEIEILSRLDYKRLNIKAYDKEIKDYLLTHSHTRLEILKEGNKRNPVLYIF